MKSSTYRLRPKIFLCFSNVLLFTFLVFASFQKPYLTIKNKTYAISSPYNLKSRQYHYKIQLHAHTKNSDGGSEPMEVMEKYESLGYLAVAITDHDGEWRGFYPSLEDPGGHHIIHIPGIEYSHKDVIDNKYTSWGHMVSIGISTVCHNRGEGNRQEQIDQAKSEGGLSFWAHPDHRTGILKDTSYIILGEFLNYAGIEIFNAQTANSPKNDANVDYILSVLGRKIFLFGSSDYHRGCLDCGHTRLVSEKKKGIKYTDIIRHLSEGRFYTCGRTNESLPNSPKLFIYDDGKTIYVKTNIKCDIEFITGKYNYYYKGDDYAKIEKSTKSSYYTPAAEDKYVRIKATYYQNGGSSQSWSNPLFIESYK